MERDIEAGSEVPLEVLQFANDLLDNSLAVLSKNNKRDLYRYKELCIFFHDLLLLSGGDSTIRQKIKLTLDGVINMEDGHYSGQFLRQAVEVLADVADYEQAERCLRAYEYDEHATPEVRFFLITHLLQAKNKRGLELFSEWQRVTSIEMQMRELRPVIFTELIFLDPLFADYLQEIASHLPPKYFETISIQELVIQGWAFFGKKVELIRREIAEMTGDSLGRARLLSALALGLSKRGQKAPEILIEAKGLVGEHRGAALHEVLQNMLAASYAVNLAPDDLLIMDEECLEGEEITDPEYAELATRRTLLSLAMAADEQNFFKVLERLKAGSRTYLSALAYGIEVAVKTPKKDNNLAFALTLFTQLSKEAAHKNQKIISEVALTLAIAFVERGEIKLAQKYYALCSADKSKSLYLLRALAVFSHGRLGWSA